MKKIIVFILLLSGVNLWAQDYLSNYDNLKKNNYLNQFSHFDFSQIWIDSNNERGIYGIIGENHQRIKIKILNIEKSPYNDNTYLFIGKTKVKNNIVDFNGVIKVRKILLFKHTKKYYGDLVKQNGVIVANYKFVEPEKQSGSGIFRGKLYSNWVIMKKTPNKVEYDDLEYSSDSFNNNVFIGSWTSYRTKKQKKCNWGDWRVPFANSEFDIGAGEFSPSDKYLQFGWENYRKAFVEQDKEAQKIEEEKWWE